MRVLSRCFTATAAHMMCPTKNMKNTWGASATAGIAEIATLPPDQEGVRHEGYGGPSLADTLDRGRGLRFRFPGLFPCNQLDNLCVPLLHASPSDRTPCPV